MKADVKAVYEAMSKEEASRYAFVEMNIKNWDYFNAAYGMETGNEVLEEITKTLENFLTNQGYWQRTYRETYHFLFYVRRLRIKNWMIKCWILF